VRTSPLVPALDLLTLHQIRINLNLAVVTLRDQIMNALQTRGIRCTAQRLAVMECVASHPVHATAEEVFQQVNRQEPRASRATVYNCLHTLVQAGLVREVDVDGRACRFDANMDRHHHFVCHHCGNVEDIRGVDLPEETHRGALGLRSVSDYEIVFRGICESCLQFAHRNK
jgi:Fur family peroxide stress response transcriptional regulator